MVFLRYLALFAALNLVCVSAVLAVETPITMGELLARLESAEREMSFRGRFTHEHGGTIDAFEILRVVVDGIEYEKTSQLSGPEREQVSVGRDTRCLTKSNHLLRGNHLNLKLGGAVSLDQSYNFYFLGEDRIADRVASVIRIEPKDAYRYGYWLSIDKRSGLVIRSIITSGNKTALERVQYIVIDEIEGQVESVLSAGELSQLRGDLALQGEGIHCDISVKHTSPWRPAWVPPGFLLTAYSFTEQDGHMETYSDGLGVFSVFVNDHTKPASARVLANRGATVAFMSRVTPTKGQQLDVAVVGEIPLRAAQKIASSISSANSGE